MGEDRRASRQGNTWTAAELEALKAAYLDGKMLAEIAVMLGRTEAAVGMKVNRMGLAAYRRHGRRVVTTEEVEELLADDPLQAGYRYLDHNYTAEEVLAAYAVQPLETEERRCVRCQRMTAFESRFQRWCSPCRRRILAAE